MTVYEFVKRELDRLRLRLVCGEEPGLLFPAPQEPRGEGFVPGTGRRPSGTGRGR